MEFWDLNHSPAFAFVFIIFNSLRKKNLVSIQFSSQIISTFFLSKSKQDNSDNQYSHRYSQRLWTQTKKTNQKSEWSSLRINSRTIRARPNKNQKHSFIRRSRPIRQSRWIPMRPSVLAECLVRLDRSPRDLKHSLILVARSEPSWRTCLTHSSLSELLVAPPETTCSTKCTSKKVMLALSIPSNQRFLLKLQPMLQQLSRLTKLWYLTSIPSSNNSISASHWSSNPLLMRWVCYLSTSSVLHLKKMLCGPISTSHRRW